MPFRKNDFDAEERDFVTRVKLPACPEVGLLFSAREGILAADQAHEVEAHLAGCEVCRTLLGDLETIDFGNPTAIDAANTRDRIRRSASGAFAPAKLKREPGFRRWLVPALALAACAVLALILVRSFKSEPAPAPSATQVAQARPLPDVPLEKLAIHVDASALLATRGSSTTGPGTELAKALAPYQKGDYAEAAQRLGNLAQKYPQDPTVALYLGVTDLLLDRNQEGARNLENAVKLNEGARLADSQWYLGIADLRVKDALAATTVFHALCEGNSSYRERACTIESELK